MRVLITGAAGFIGSRLAATLANEGHEVVGLVHRSTVLPRCLSRVVVGDITDASVVIDAMRGVDVVFHLAAITSHAEIVDHRFQTLDINWRGTKNVLDAFVSSSRSRSFFFSSTGKVYGDIQRLPLDESHPALPMNILGKSKYITERLVDFYAGSEKSFVSFRIFNVFGEGQRDSFFIPTLFRQIEEAVHRREAIRLRLGDLRARRDYVHVDDVVSAFVGALMRYQKTGFQIFNVCSGQGRSGQDILDAAARGLGRPVMVESDFRMVRVDEKDEEFGSFERLGLELGWAPKVDVLDWVNARAGGLT